MTAITLGMIALITLAFAGVPLGYTLMIVGFFGFAAFRGFYPAIEMAAEQILSLAMNFEFSTLPLFILMGVLIGKAGLSDELYEAADAWLGHFRGGLAMATVAACGGFACVSGSSIATAATMAKVALPSMRRFGYADGFAAGTVAAGGTLGVLMPPSAGLIVYGILTGTDIGALFVAGILPGLLTIAVYFAAIVIVTNLRPEFGPRGRRASWNQRFSSLFKIWAVVALFLLIVGGLFFGAFTPTEAGGIGAIGALCFAAARRTITVRQFFESLLETARLTAAIFTVAFGALILNNFVNISGTPQAVAELIRSLDLSPLGVMTVILFFYVVLGVFIEGLAMIFLTAPIFVPLVHALGFDLIWFGVFMVMIVEISLITPPIGLNVYIIKAMLPDVPLSSIFKGIVPFFIADLARMVVILFWPNFVMFLPNLMH